VKRYAAFPALLLLLLLPAGRAHGLPAEELRRLLGEATGFFNEAASRTDTDPAVARELYQKALLRFTRIAEEGGIRNAKLFYNIGNTQYHLGNLGLAILNYRKALACDEGDANLLQNLETARGKRVDRIEEKERTKILRILFFWHFDLSAPLRLILFLAGFVLALAAATVRLFARRGIVDWVLGVSCAVAVMFGGSLAADSMPADRAGVILAGEVTARKGNALSFEPSFESPLHEGTEFVLREERSLWYYIELPDGRRCWIPKDAAALAR